LQVADRPDGQIGSILDFDLPENTIEIFFNSALGEVEFKRDFLVQHSLTDQEHDLFFSECENAADWRFSRVSAGLPADGADTSPGCGKLSAAPIAVLDNSYVE
jgi:hypothetical protein